MLIRSAFTASLRRLWLWIFVSTLLVPDLSARSATPLAPHDAVESSDLLGVDAAPVPVVHEAVEHEAVEHEADVHEAALHPRRLSVPSADLPLSPNADEQVDPSPPTPAPPNVDALSTSPRMNRQHLTVEDGLPINAVSDILQASTGYIWIATYDGLARFNGQQFQVYRSGDYPALPSNRFQSIDEDTTGALWLRTTRYDLVRYAKGRFEPVLLPDAGSNLKVFSTLRDPEGNLWFGTSHGLARPSEDDPSTLTIPPHLQSIDGIAYSAAWNDDGSMWVGTFERGLLHIEPDGAPVVYRPWKEVQYLHATDDGTLFAATQAGTFRVEPGRDPVPLTYQGQPWQTPVYRIETGTDGTLWLSTKDGTFTLRGDVVASYPTERSNRTSPLNYDIHSIGPHGNTWVRAGTGVYRDGRKVLDVPSGTGPLIHDREGNTWVATQGDGLWRLRPSGIRGIGPADGVPAQRVYPVLQRRTGEVWLATRASRLVRLSGSTVTTIPEMPASGVPVQFVTALHEDASGTLWVGGNGLCILEDRQCISSEIPDLLTPGSNQFTYTVSSIFEDSQRRLWVGTTGGMYRRSASCARSTAQERCWRRVTDSLQTFVDPVRVIHQRTPTSTENALEAGVPELWMGTNGSGLLRYVNGRFDTLSVEQEFPSNLIRSIYEDDRGVLWIGTEDVGLIRLDPRGTPDVAAMPVTVYGTRHGLFDDVIHQILPDDHGRLWMSSNRGLFYVDRERLEAVHRGDTTNVYSVAFSERDGLRNREANGGVQPAGIRDRDGRLWFPTQEGVAIVVPDLLPRVTTPPKVALEGLRVNGTPQPFAAITSSHERDSETDSTPQIRLDASERNVSFSFASLTFSRPDRATVRYRLTPFETTWTTTQDRREAFYTNVPPGTYTFEAVAVNEHGVKSRPVQMRITIAPYVTETWAFYLVLALAVLAAGGALIKWRIRTLEARKAELERSVDDQTERIRQKNDQLEQQAYDLKRLDRAKGRFFANVSHELRTPLTLLLGPTADALRNDRTLASEELEMLHDNATRLERLIEQLLDLSILDADALELQRRRVDLAAFARRTGARFEDHAQRHRIAFHVTVPKASVPVSVDPVQFEKVVDNLLTNAIKYTPPGGAVTLQVTRTAAPSGDGNGSVDDDSIPRHAQVVVTDTGPGIPEGELLHLFDRFERGSAARSQQGAGIGLALAKELVERHDGTIRAENHPAGGTRFVVSIPCRTEDAHRADDGDGTTAEGDFRPAAAGVHGPRTGRRPSSPGPSTTGLSGGSGRTGTSPKATADRANGQETCAASSASSEDRPVILVIDDHADIRRYVTSIFTPAFEVVAARDGADGLQNARTCLPDCIIADVMMPKMDGFALARALQNDPLTEGIPLLFLTARAALDDELKALDRGADAYLTKPFSSRRLQRRVEALIAKRRRLRSRLAAAGSHSAETSSPDSTDDALPVEAENAPSTRAPSPFVEEVTRAVQDRITDTDFTVGDLADAVSLSRSQLYRRLKQDAGASPSQFIREIRLAKARALLRRRAGNVTEIAYAVGFSSLSYFSDAFRSHYGTSPSEIMKET